MKNYIKIFVVYSVLFYSIPVFSQVDTNVLIPHKYQQQTGQQNETTLNFLVSYSYGFSYLTDKGLEKDFNVPCYQEIAVGSQTITLLDEISQLSHSYLYVSYLSNGLNFWRNKNNIANVNLLNAGIGYKYGFSKSYKFNSPPKILTFPYWFFKYGIGKINIKSDLNSLSQGDQIELNKYNDAFRYNSAKGGGILFKIHKIDFDVSYERQVLHPRFQILNSLISEAVEYASYSTVLFGNILLSKILKLDDFYVNLSSLVIVNVCLNLFSELRKGNMNWPLHSDTPIMVNNFKLGINYNF